MDNIVTVLSMNVRGLFSNSKKRTDVFDWAKGKNASVICFQETHSNKDIEKKWEEEWGNKCFFSHHSNKSAGVSIMFKIGLDFEVHNSIIDIDGRYIILDLSLSSQRITFVCLYGFNTDEPSFFNDIYKKMATFSNTSFLLCGDWNVVQDTNIDTYNIIHNRNPNSRKKIEEIVESLELLDPWRTCYPNDRKYTWRQCSPIKQSRLDFFLVTEDLFSLMKNTSIIPGYKTDHSAITFTFSASLAKRGKGYWKFNSQLLRDLDYIKKVKTCINESILEYYESGNIDDPLNVKLSCNDQVFFELIKMKIRSLTIGYSIQKAREEKAATLLLENDIQNLENCMNISPDGQIHAALNQKKLELENIREKKIEGVFLRSHANWQENGEKCSEFFCKLEKKNFIKKTITELIDEKGKHISDQSRVLQEEMNFFKTLYSSKNLECDDESFFKHNVKLTEDEKDLCEGNISFKECAESLKSMSNGKSPGSDGYTVEFYKVFWRDIGPFLFRSLHFGYENGEFSKFQYQSVITCIPKEDKDRRYLANWRPISLMNTDTKIASAVIANRIKPVLPSIISDCQKGFIKDRFMGENTRLLYDLMHYLEKHNKTGLLLLVDFEKAFDSIEWSFLKKALKSFNFGPSICKWFEVFYLKASSCVINNGHLSSFFNLERSCRQGDPLSPYLFIIGVELLSMKIRSNPKIEGTFFHENESLLSQYADDTFLVLDGTETSLRETLNCFDSFQKVSGLKINSSKTKAVWVGNKKYSDLILCPDLKLQWCSSNFKLLGIEFSLDLDSMPEINFSKKIKEVSGILKSWQHRKLTLMGKITVIKTLALPKLIHLLTALPNLPESKLNELNTLFFQFIWNGKPDRIRRSTLIGDIPQGGLNMINIHYFNIYLKIGWIKRFSSNLYGSWQSLLLKSLEQYGGERVLHFQKEKLREISDSLSNPFWKDVFFSFHVARPATNISVQDILSLDILNFAPLVDFPYFTQWQRRGVQSLFDLINLETKDFCNFDQIGPRLQTNNFLKYYGLIAKIPKYMREHIKENIAHVNFVTFNCIDNFLERLLCNKKAKFVYKDLVDRNVQLPTEKFLQWEQLLGIEIADWSKYYIILRKSCKDTYLGTFQYKF